MLTESQLAAKRKWTAKNKEKILAYRRDYYDKNKEKVLGINKKWRDANPEQVAELRHSYYESNKKAHNKRCREWEKKNREKANASKKKWIKGNPTAREAHTLVNNAVKLGKMHKQPCYCGSTDVHAHHEDYSKPLDVTWLCPQHHKDLHKAKN